MTTTDEFSEKEHDKPESVPSTFREKRPVPNWRLFALNPFRNRIKRGETP